MDFKNDSRFAGIEPFKIKLWLSSPTMHGDEQRWVDDAIQTNWVSTVGENINVVEKEICRWPVLWYVRVASSYETRWRKALRSGTT